MWHSPSNILFEASALGLLVYRGVLPFIAPDEVQNSYKDVVLPVRERLKLPAADPLKEFLDTRTIDADLALREAEEKFEAKRREVRAVKESLKPPQKELARREPIPAPVSPVPAATGEKRTGTAAASRKSEASADGPQ